MKRTYFDDLSLKRKSHCFKWDMPGESIIIANKAYIRVNSSDLSWVQAEEFCKSYNGHLVSITSAEEEQLVKYLFDGGSSLTPSAVYIGLKAINSVSIFSQWHDKNYIHYDLF